MISIVRRGTIVASAGVLLAATGALAVSRSLYSGGTDQHEVAHHAVALGIDLYVTATKLTEVKYYANYSGDSPLCASQFDRSLTIIHPDAVIHDGTFLVAKTDNGTTGGDVVRNLEGRFRGRTVSGSFTEQFATYDRAIKRDIHCTSGKVTFTAKRAVRR